MAHFHLQIYAFEQFLPPIISKYNTRWRSHQQGELLRPIYVEETFKVIANLHQQGVTILLVEQNAQKALSAADRGYVLETGEIVLSDQAEEKWGQKWGLSQYCSARLLVEKRKRLCTYNG